MLSAADSLVSKVFKYLELPGLKALRALYVIILNLSNLLFYYFCIDRHVSRLNGLVRFSQFRRQKGTVMILPGFEKYIFPLQIGIKCVTGTKERYVNSRYQDFFIAEIAQAKPAPGGRTVFDAG